MIEKAVEHESGDCTNCDGGLGSWRTGKNYPKDSIIKNGQNTEKSPEDMRRLVVSQTPVKNHQLIREKF